MTQNIMAFVLKQHDRSNYHIFFPEVITVFEIFSNTRWAGHVARMGGLGMHIVYWWGSQKERDH
jgi:hypothetical protein